MPPGSRIDAAQHAPRPASGVARRSPEFHRAEAGVAGVMRKAAAYVFQGAAFRVQALDTRTSSIEPAPCGSKRQAHEGGQLQNVAGRLRAPLHVQHGLSIDEAAVEGKRGPVGRPYSLSAGWPCHLSHASTEASRYGLPTGPRGAIPSGMP